MRLIVPTMGWDDHVHLAFDEVRMAGAGSNQVSRRLRAALEDRVRIAPPDRRPVLQDQLDRLGALVDLRVADDRDADHARQLDHQGIGARAVAGSS